MDKTRIFVGYAIAVVIALACYLLYKLYVINWFGNATGPTLLFCSVVFIGFVFGMFHIVQNFFKSKGSK